MRDLAGVILLLRSTWYISINEISSSTAKFKMNSIHNVK